MPDILVETFDVDIGVSGSTYTLTSDVGSVANAFVRKVTSSDKATGLTGSTSNLSPANAHCGVALTNTSELTFYKGNANTQKIVGEVWRYTGASGGVNEFINRGSYAITLTGTSATQAVSGLVDRNKAVPILNGISTTNSSVNDYDASTVAVHINSSGEIVVSRQATTGTLIVYVTVVEFTGSNWSVGHGVSSSHDVSAETVTLNTDSTGAGGSTFDVGDVTTCMILDASCEGDTAETGLADVIFLTRPISTTQVTFDFQTGDTNARNDGTGYVHVIQHGDLIVTRDQEAITEGNGTYGTIAFPAGTNTTRNIDQLALEWFVSTSGTGTAHARGRLTGRITDATGTIQHWVHRTGNNVIGWHGVVDLSQVTSVATGTRGLKLGSGTINKLYLGLSQMNKAYLGSTIVHEN